VCRTWSTMLTQTVTQAIGTPYVDWPVFLIQNINTTLGDTTEVVSALKLGLQEVPKQEWHFSYHLVELSAH